MNKINKNYTSFNKEIYLSKLINSKNRSTYNTKKLLKDRELSFKPILVDIVYYSGFSKSIKEAKHMILTNNIKINGNIINKPNIKIKSGDIITSINSKCLLSYYQQRWNCIKINPILDSRLKKRMFKKFKYMIPNIHIHKLGYNTVLYI